ncbi:MAG: hypothetical protein J6A67_03450 [Clostridia bacterium]|nr:hypothetical protein [Clostridia bacterium]
MIFKKSSAFFLSVLMIFSLAACGKDKNPNAPEENTTSVTNGINDTGDTIDASEAPSATVTDETTSAVDGTTDVSESSSVPANAPTQNSDDPSKWTKEQIVEAYKTAAKKTHSSVKSQHKIEMKKVLVNNKEIDFIVPIMSTLLKNNSTEKDGITGGYQNLTASDVASAKAYKNGSSLIIEMTMNKQTAGANEDANSGSVGHAITAVGDISVVTKQLADLKLPLELNEKETKIYYTNPTVRVLIDPNGKIVNGTWQYTVDIRLNNYNAFGQPVDSTSVVMVNTLTVNGGFKKM